MRPFNKIKTFTSVIAFIFISLSCKQDEPVINSQILLSPSNLSINDGDITKIYLSIQPSNTQTWTISKKPEWMNISKMQGDIKDKIIELEVTTNSDALNEGLYSGEIEVISNGSGTSKSSVQLIVGANPKASVSITSLDFGDTDLINFSITNTGKGFLNISHDFDLPWLSIEPKSAILQQGKKMDFKAKANRSGQPVGQKQGKVTITTNAKTGNANLDVKMNVLATIHITPTIDTLNFGLKETQKTFYLKNIGNVSGNFTIDNQNAELSFNPNSGIIKNNDSLKIVAELNRNGLTNQTFNRSIKIVSGSKEFVFPIKYIQFIDLRIGIIGKVIDAEFQRSSNRLIYITEGPNQLNILDIATKTVKKVGLNKSPNCVSVSMDGTNAVVGSDASFDLVDLSKLTISKTYPVSTNLLDIIIAPNNWVYAFPTRDQWETIRCIDLANGQEFNHKGNSIYAGTKGKLHPSGKYFYGANNGVSPSNVEKFDIKNNIAEYLYRSPYHGTYEFSGDLWFSDDGLRLFAKSKNVFSISNNQSNDLLYNGVLKGDGLIVSLDHSTGAQKIYTIFTEGNYWEFQPSNKIRVFNAEFLNFEKDIKLEDFVVPDGAGFKTVSSQGFFGFFNKDGNKFIVVVKAKNGSGLLNEWAIEILDVK